jgi:hypothetical protein
MSDETAPIDARELLNQLRSEKGLPPLPMSPSAPIMSEDERNVLFKRVLEDMFPEVLEDSEFALTEEDLEEVVEEFENQLDKL